MGYYEDKANELFVLVENANANIDMKLKSVHPRDLVYNKVEVLREAKDNVESKTEILEKLKNAIKGFMDKFKNVTNNLTRKNTKWLGSVAEFESSKLNDVVESLPDDFQYEVWDYYKGAVYKLNKMNVQSCTFEDVEKNPDVLDDNEKFLEKYFPEYMDKKTKQINKDMLRSGIINNPKKVIIKKNDAAQYFRTFFRYLKIWNNWAINVHKSNRFIERTLDKVINGAFKNNGNNDDVNEPTTPTSEEKIIDEKNGKDETKQESALASYLLYNSIHKDEYYDVIMEDAVEENGGEKVKSDAESNAETEHDLNTKERCRKWASSCYAINTARMDILEEGYSEAVKYIQKIMDTKIKPKENNNNNNSDDENQNKTSIISEGEKDKDKDKQNTNSTTT